MNIFGTLFNNLESAHNHEPGNITLITCPNCGTKNRYNGRNESMLYCARCETSISVVDGDQLEAAKQAQELADWTAKKRAELLGTPVFPMDKLRQQAEKLKNIKTTDDDTIIDIPYEEV